MSRTPQCCLGIILRD